MPVTVLHQGEPPELEMYFTRGGEGEPLLLLHGFTGLGSDWDYVFPQNLDGFSSIKPDLRGHGRSTNPSGEFSFRQCALDVLGLMDSLQIDRFKAIGMSGGALTLLHIAEQQPSRIEALVLVSATRYYPPQARAIMDLMREENQTEADWQMMRGRHVLGDEQIRALWKHGRAFKDDHTDVNFSMEALKKAPRRTLIVHGDRDPIFGVAQAMELHTAIEDSHLWVVPNGGHGPIFGEFAGPFAKTALEFLRGKW